MKSGNQLAQFTHAVSNGVREVFRLSQGEEQTQRDFEKLSFEVFNHISERRPVFTVHVNPRKWSAETLAANSDLPEDLAARVRAWQDQFEAFLVRNPRAELYLMLRALSESINSTSWFSDRAMESKLLHWVDADQFEPYPFYDCHKIVTEDFYRKLQGLRKQCGGWLFYTHIAHIILFAAGEHLSEVRWTRARDGTYHWPTFWPKWQ